MNAVGGKGPYWRHMADLLGETFSDINLTLRTLISMYVGETKLYEIAFFHRSSRWSLGCSGRCEIVICCWTELLPSPTLSPCVFSIWQHSCILIFIVYFTWKLASVNCWSPRANTGLLCVCSRTVICHVHHIKNSIKPTVFFEKLWSLAPLNPNLVRSFITVHLLYFLPLGRAEH